MIDLIDESAQRLDETGVAFGQGTTNAFDEAVWLVLWRLGLSLDDLDAVAERAVSSDELVAVQALIEQRIASRRPSAYLTGEAWLQGVPFYADERAIVPRSLIAECLVDGTIDAWLGDPPRRVLDVCTGGASLAVLAALAWPAAIVDATDLSADALALARRNVERHGLAGRIMLHQGDGVAPVAGRRFDLILCNPPYVNRASMAALPAEFRAEPALALDGNAGGGVDGMDFIRTLLRDVPPLLAEGAALVLEIGHERAHFERAFPRLDVVWLPTSAGDDQVLLIQRAALFDRA